MWWVTRVLSAVIVTFVSVEFLRLDCAKVAALFFLTFNGFNAYGLLVEVTPASLKVYAVAWCVAVPCLLLANGVCGLDDWFWPRLRRALFHREWQLKEDEERRRRADPARQTPHERIDDLRNTIGERRKRRKRRRRRDVLCIL